MLKNYFREKIKIGLSVNSTKLSYVVATEKNGDYELLDRGCSLIDESTALLKKLKKAYDFPCYLALPHQFVMSKTLHFSENFKEDDIRDLLTLNAEHYFSAPGETVYFDFEFVNSTKRNVRVVASRKEYIQEWRNLFQEVALVLVRVGIDVIAIERLLSHLNVIDNEVVYALFIWHEMEMLQIVLVNGFSFFQQSTLMSDSTVDNICQEMIKFFRLYELTKSFLHPIEKVILLGFDQKLREEIVTMISYSLVNHEVFDKKLSACQEYFISFGMILG